jgi:ATP-binding cassette, subfamily C, bacterial PrsD
VLGRSTGYLPQDVQLFDGTIAENIARFDEAPDEARIQAAATLAGLDLHIRAKYAKTGYNTQVGPYGSLLAGGLRQRLGLARALYGEPFLLVLDEPNSNLDDEGNAALRKAIREARARKAIVIIVTHRPDALDEVDYMMLLANGTIEDSGTREKILPKWLARQAPNGPPPSPPRPRPNGNGHTTIEGVVTNVSSNGSAAASDLNGGHQAAAPNGERGPAPAVQSWSTAPLKLTRNQIRKPK